MRDTLRTATVRATDAIIYAPVSRRLGLRDQRPSRSEWIAGAAVAERLSGVLLGTTSEMSARPGTMTGPPSGTVTFLFSDIEGSTRLLEALGRDRYGEVLREHQRLLRGVWARHEGYEVDTEGDAFFVAFAQPSQGLAAASDAQRVLANAHWVDDRELRVRIGLHSGEASLDDGRYVGMAVHRAARIAAAAHGGQVLASDTTRALCADDTPPDLRLRDLGMHRLKDLTDPQRLYQLITEGLPSDFPPPRTLENRPTNLPTQPTPLVGRERELFELQERLARDDVRLLTLTGPGGSGKTRLALQLAAERVEHYPDGVWFVNLAALTEVGLVLPTLAQTVGVQEQAGETIENALANHLRDKRMLVVLDNFEHLLEAATGLAGLLRRTEAVTFVVTSRSRLQLAGEHEYAVPSLAETEALALFTQRAQAVKPGFSLNGNRPIVAEICARLDRLPLAIELAAARMKLLPERALLQRLNERLKVLTGGARDLDERQRTLRAAIDWSYGLLDEREQCLFRRLAVFAGGRTLEAIEAVCDQDGDLGVDVLDGLASLVDKSLLRQEEGPDGEARFVMLETIHEYARELLDATDESGEIRLQHARFYFELAAADAPFDWWGFARSSALAPELPNFRLALEELARRADVESELQLAAKLEALWYLRGLLGEARASLEQALAHAEGASDETRGRALDALSDVAFRQGRVADALRLAEEAAALARRADNSSLLAHTLESWGLAANASGDFNAARSKYEEALAVARDAGDARREASLVSNLGELAISIGDYEQARQLSSEAVAAFRAQDAEGDAAYSLFNLAVANLYLGAVDDALAGALEVLGVCRDSNREGIAVCLELLAAIAARRHATEAGAVMLGAAERLLTEIGHALGPVETRLHEQTLETLHASLDEERLAQAWASGAKLEDQEAVEYAMSIPTDAT